MVSCIFFFKQKTAYDMRISDGSSDVCSSDLRIGEVFDTRITGVQSFGFFATIMGLGGDGLVPVSTLGRERFRYEEAAQALVGESRSEEHTSELQSLMRISYAVFCLKKKTTTKTLRIMTQSNTRGRWNE